MKVKTVFKQTEIGEIPTDWQIVQVKDIVEKNRKVTYGIVQPGQYNPDGVLLIRGKDYIKGWQRKEDFFRVAPSLHQKYSRSLTKAGDILLCIAGVSVGVVNQVPDWIEEANITQTTARISCDSIKANPKFVLYFLESNLGRKQSTGKSKGSAQPGINLSEVAKFYIPLPDITEQQKIAEVLVTIDSIIQKSKIIIKKTQLLKKSLTDQLLIKGINHTNFKQTEMGEIPKEWDIVRLGDNSIAQIIMGQSPSSSTYNAESKGLPFLQGNADFGETYPNPTTYTTSPIKISLKDDILISVRAPVGAVNLSPFKCCIGRGLSAIRTNSKKLNHLFTFYYVKHTSTKLHALSTGSTFKAIKKSDLGDYQIALPPVEEQERIVAILSEFDKKIEFEIKRKEKMDQIKKGLMDDLLTGKKRLN